MSDETNGLEQLSAHFEQITVSFAQALSSCINALGTCARDGALEQVLEQGEAPSLREGILRDGTLVLQPNCPKGGACPPAWVRKPKSQGEDLWRPTRVEGALAYRALARGEALVITRGSGPGRIGLWIDRPGRAPSAVAEDVRVDGDATKLRVAEDGRIVLEVAMTTRGRQDQFLTRSGHLLPLEKDKPVR